MKRTCGRRPWRTVNQVAILGVLLLGASAYAEIRSVLYNFDNGKAKGWSFPNNSAMTQYPGGAWSVENGALPNRSWVTTTMALSTTGSVKPDRQGPGDDSRLRRHRALVQPGG